MRIPKLKLMDLVLGLEMFGGRYKAIGVFADDLLEARDARPVDGLVRLDAEARRFRFTVPPEKVHAGRSYDLEIFPEDGMLRMARPSGEPGDASLDAPPGMTGAPATEAIATAQRKRGRGAEEDELVLGLLEGDFVTTARGPDAPRRVFTLQLDPSTAQWGVYDGGLVRWMKEHLLARSA